MLTAGSYMPNPWIIPGVSFHEELELLHEAGIPPIDVLRSATWNGAQALGIADQIGSIESGKQADLVVLANDPSIDIRSTRSIVMVIADGRVIDRTLHS